MFEQRIELLKEKTGMTTHVLSDNAIAALVANERESSSTVDGLPELTDTHIKGQRSALILFTSGTTGQPKGVVSTHGALEAQTSTLVKAWQWTHLDRIHHTLPLHHIHGIINALACALYSGATVEMYEKFDSQQVWWRWLATLQPTSSFAEQESPLTLFMSVPTVYSRLIAHYNGMEESQRPLYSKACQQFRCMVSGSASLPTPLRDTWHALSNHVLLERYGMTEIGMALSQGYAVEERVQGTVGLPLPGVQVRLIAHDTDTQENGKDVTNTRNVSGMIEVKGTHVFKEYWGRPEATQKEMTREGWFITGDIAIRVEEQGYYKILGRNSIDIIKSGGEKVSALEVERELLSCHLGIEDVAVIGISDMEWGQRVAAVVVMEKEKTLTLQTMRDTLKQRVAVYKVPVYLCTVPELPKNAMGKVMKKQLSCLFA
ncbi:hypothetical protein BDF14DRAFT_1789352 [Spinellus fusiger]|nr:hypothetical protein BDF14DRAFT_1789352 [Spinellus fusiger]